MTRLKADISSGLAPVREARPIRSGERIHLLGAAGAGASAAALLAHHAGARVSGCDPGGPSPYSAAVEAAGIRIAWSHSAAHVELPARERPERLAVTKALTAVKPDHPELLAAHRYGIRAEPWQQLVADAAATTGQRLVAVAGTHGKSTTAGWLLHALVGGGRDPSAFVGALLRPELTDGLPATARWGRGDVFIVEADEYAGNFDAYRPAVALLLNAEWDHPDVFADEDAVTAAFADWLRAAAESVAQPVLVANLGDAGAGRVLERLHGWPGRIVGVRLLEDPPIPGFDEIAPELVASFTSVPGGGGGLNVKEADGSERDYSIGLPGRHNAANALVLIAAARVLGIEEGALRRSLAEFGGVGRRLELKGDVGGVIVLDDYGHHPTAIERTLEAVRQRYPGRPVWAVYEPLTFHRTAQMLERFADVLADADSVAIADIWAGRDRDTTLTSSAALADAVSARGRAPASAPGSVEATADYLAERVRRGDVVLVMGGGRSYLIAQRLVELLAAKSGGGTTPAAR